VITVAKATSAEYYSGGGSSSGGAASYYLDAVTEGEPPGRWIGRQARDLGLVGDVEAHVMNRLYNRFQNPVTGEQLGSRPAQWRSVEDRLAEALAAEPDAIPERVAELRERFERGTRKNLIGWDATFNVPKSVTVVHTALHRAEIAAVRSGNADRAAEYGAVRQQIENLIHEANDAGMAVLEQLATSRTGGGSGTPARWIAADKVTIASFFQQTNRSIDPHLHVHNVVLNRAMCADGEIRALDGRDLLAQRFAFSAVSDRVLTEGLARMGFTSQVRADGLGRELTCVPAEVIAHYSTRRQQVTTALEPLVAAATERLGRELTDLELHRLAQQATLATRQAKTHSDLTVEEQLNVWATTLINETGRTLDGLANRALDELQRGAVPAQHWSPSSVMAEAIAACATRSATWRRANLINELELRLPTLGLTSDQVAPLLDKLADEALSSIDVVQVAGIDAGDHAAPSARRYAATGTMAAEQALRNAALTRSGLAADGTQIGAWLDAHAPSMGPDQRAAVLGLATTDAAVSVLIGPAGTGKSYAAGAFANAWSETTGGRVVGLAVSQIATTVLRDDGVTDAANVAAWLAAQDRLAAADVAVAGAHALDDPWRLSPRDVVMVDEASMVSTSDLDAIRRRVETAGARLVLTGDPRQLAAVEAGGALDLLDGHAETFHLSEVRRFEAPWERHASLALRDGDLAALAEYDVHGRLVEHASHEDALAAAARAAVADRLDGRTVVVVAGSNADAARVSGQVRDALVELKIVDEVGVLLGRDGCTAGAGDLIACRRNDYRLNVTNRAQYRVEKVAEDGGLVVRDLAENRLIELPAAYVAEDVQLAYASTVHAAQGITVDSAHLVTQGGLDAAALYVGLSRGRIRNTAHVAVTAETADLPRVPGATGETVLTGESPRPSAYAVLAGALDQAAQSASALVTAEADEARRTSMASVLGQIENHTRVACRERMERHLDDMVAAGTLDPGNRARLAADQASEHLSRLLRVVEQAGEAPRRVLAEAITGLDVDLADASETAIAKARTSLADTHSVAQVLSHRITRAGQWLPEPTASGVPADLAPADAERLTALHEVAESRAGDLGAQVADEAPAWALLALGPVPDAGDTPEAAADRTDWQRRAGLAAAYREAAGHDDAEHALPRMPGVSTTERRATYAAAWHALGRPQPALIEAGMSDGQLLTRARAWENQQAWAPPHVNDALRKAETDAEDARQGAALADAEGRSAEASDLRGYAALRAAAASGWARVAERRTEWFLRTLSTRHNGEAAARELAERGLTPGTEPDRATAHTYLGLDTDPAALDRTAIEAEDAHRLVTDADVRDITAEDDEWAASGDDRSPEIQLPEPPRPPADTAAAKPAHQQASPSASLVEMQVAVAAAVVSARIAADQASQEAARRPAVDLDYQWRIYDAARDRRADAGLDDSYTDAAVDTAYAEIWGDDTSSADGDAAGLEL
jgi:conjugative relaxase-like TrwC/TraI family protein